MPNTGNKKKKKQNNPAKYKCTGKISTKSHLTTVKNIDYMVCLLLGLLRK